MHVWQVAEVMENEDGVLQRFEIVDARGVGRYVNALVCLAR
jgi:hypothetical protein